MAQLQELENFNHPRTSAQERCLIFSGLLEIYAPEKERKNSKLTGHWRGRLRREKLPPKAAETRLKRKVTAEGWEKAVRRATTDRKGGLTGHWVADGFRRGPCSEAVGGAEQTIRSID